MLLKATVLFAALPALAAETLSLEQAVAMALDGPGNLDVQLAQKSVSQADAQVAQARALLLPSLGLSATEQNQSRNLGAEGFRFTDLPGFRIPAQVGPYNTFDSRASLQQTVFNASLWVRRKSFQFNARAQKLAEQQTRELVAARVAHAYLDILSRRNRLAGVRADIQFATAKVSIAREKLAAGNGIPLDVTSALTDLRDIQFREVEEQSAYDKARLTLLDLCNLELTNDFEPVAPSPWSAIPHPDSISSRADIASAESQAESARSTDRALQFERLPTVSAYADAGVFGGVETHTVGVSVNVPVFDGGRHASRRAEALSILQAEQIKLKQLQRKAQLELAQARLAVRSAEQQLVIANETRQAANEIFDHARRMVGTGGFDRLLELQADNRKAHAEIDASLARIRLEEAQLDVAAATGSVVELIHPAR